jgi:hypothetical protein
VLLPVAAADVRRVELLSIASSRDWDEWDTVPGETLDEVAGADAAAIVRLVADLPDAESMMRCFNPAYALKAHGAEGVLVEIAFCFRCHNALVIVPGGGRAGLVAIEPDSPAGQELLARFKAGSRNGTAEA